MRGCPDGRHAGAPRAGVLGTLKRLVVGEPLATHAAPHQRLSKKVGLAIFSSDAVASSAFATQEILHILVPVLGIAAIGYLGPISLLVVGCWPSSCSATGRRSRRTRTAAARTS